MLKVIKAFFTKQFLPYGLLIVLVVVTFILGAAYSLVERDRYFTLQVADIHLGQQTKQQLLQQEAMQQLELAVDLIAADSRLKALLLDAANEYANDETEADLTLLRQRLLPLLDTYWQSLKPFGASQLHLHLAPDAFTLLRAHRPERHSDRLSNIRPIVMHSLNTGTRVTGTEHGRHGLGLRAVVPVIDSDGQVKAAIELGFDLPNIFAPKQRSQPETDVLPDRLIGSPAGQGLHGMALLAKRQITAVFLNDVKDLWFETAYWSSYAPSEKLQFWLNNNLLPQQVMQPEQQILTYNERVFAVSLQPWPIWGAPPEQVDQLVSLSWQDITAQVKAQQHANNMMLFIWFFACIVMLLVGGLLVSRLRRQALQEVLTQQKLLKQSEQKLSSLYQLSPLPILLNRFSDGAFVQANPAMTKLVGYTLDEISQLSYWDLTPESYADAEQLQLQSLVETGRYGPYVKHYKHKNGELIDIELNGVLFDDGEGERYIWTIIQDIREIKRVEKLKDDFVSTVSHELRTPLTSIAGSLGLVLGGAAGTLSPKAEKLLSIAHKNSQRLNMLINDLLDIDKLMAGKMRFDETVITLSKLLQDAVEQNQPYAKQHGVTLNLTSTSNVKLFVDSARIQQVLANFISNAVKFSPANSQVQLYATVIANKVRISVQDEGPGIAIIDKHRLFQRFSQLDQAAGQAKSGTGLGLAISREIVLQSGGDVGLNSALGEGSIFWLELPLHHVQKMETGSDAILVVEDDTDTAHLLCEFLTAENYTADWAPDSQTAWQKLAEGNYAALTLDLKLKNESGADFFLRLRDNPATAHLPVLVISAYQEQGKLQLAALANAMDWLEKPISPELLSLKLGQLLSKLPALDRFHRILHIEDDNDIVTIMRMQLEHQCQYMAVSTLSEAKIILAQERFELILLDLGLPDGNGISVLSTVTETQGDIPVVIFSAQDVNIENTLKVQAVFSKSRINTEYLANYLKKILN